MWYMSTPLALLRMKEVDFEFEGLKNNKKKNQNKLLGWSLRVCIFDIYTRTTHSVRIWVLLSVEWVTLGNAEPEELVVLCPFMTTSLLGCLGLLLSNS